MRILAVVIVVKSKSLNKALAGIQLIHAHTYKDRNSSTETVIEGIRADL